LELLESGGKRWVRGSSLTLCLTLVTLIIGCESERRKSDAELGLNPQQAEGRHLYDRQCDRCHEPYSSSGKNGPSLQGLFKKQYMRISGLPANDERVTEIIRFGRAKMPGFGQVLGPEQTDALLAYLHTL